MGPTQLKHWKWQKIGFLAGLPVLGVMHQVGLGLGQMFVNPLHQWHEARSEVLFVPSNSAWAMLISLIDKHWACSQPTAVLQAVP